MNRQYPLFLIFMLTSAVFFSVPMNADSGWPDAGRHAMDGIFYLDFLLEGGLFAPMEYAADYYQRYPAISPVMYPPFFGLVEGAAFSVLGISFWAGRLMVAFFLCWGSWGIFQYTKEWLGDDGGLYAALIFVSLPIVIYWSRDVMLETPAMALVIWSFHYFLKYLKEKKTKDVALCLVFATLGPYTKQNTIFIFPAFFVAAMLAKKINLITARPFLFGLILSFLFGIPLLIITFTLGQLNLEQSFGNLKESQSLVVHVSYYFKALPESLGLPFLILAAGGLYALRKSKNKEEIALLIAWGTIAYIQMTVIKIKEPRHGFFWIPVFAILASAGLKTGLSFFMGQKWQKSLGLMLILAIFLTNLFTCPNNWAEGFHAPAAFLKKQWEGRAVLINIHRDANFIFHARALDPDKKLRIYRSDKIFESRMIYPEWGVKSHIDSEEQIENALSSYGIRYLLLQAPMSNMTRVETLIRQAVKKEQFEEIEQFPITSPGSQAKLHLYRYNGPIENSPEIPAMHLPVIQKTIISGKLK